MWGSVAFDENLKSVKEERKLDLVYSIMLSRKMQLRESRNREYQCSISRRKQGLFSGQVRPKARNKFLKCPWTRMDLFILKNLARIIGPWRRNASEL